MPQPDARFKLIKDKDGLFWLLDEENKCLFDRDRWIKVDPIPEHRVIAVVSLAEFQDFVRQMGGSSRFIDV